MVKPDSVLYDPARLRALVRRTQLKNPLTGDEVALRKAAIGGHPRIIRILCWRYHVNVDAGDIAGWTALILAARYGRLDCVRTLLQCGADIHRATNEGWTALLYAVYNDHYDIVQLLLDYPNPPRIDHQTKTNHGWTALMYATWHQNISIMEQLVTAYPPANIMQESDKGTTALMCAEWQKRPDLRRFLEYYQIRQSKAKVCEGVRFSTLGSRLPEDLVQLLSEFVAFFK